jgi:hypothetical protein
MLEIIPLTTLTETRCTVLPVVRDGCGPGYAAMTMIGCWQGLGLGRDQQGNQAFLRQDC